MMYEKMANVPNAIADSPAASPSSPSVMFTALLVPVRMNVQKMTYTQAKPASAVTT